MLQRNLLSGVYYRLLRSLVVLDDVLQIYNTVLEFDSNMQGFNWINYVFRCADFKCAGVQMKWGCASVQITDVQMKCKKAANQTYEVSETS